MSIRPARADPGRVPSEVLVSRLEAPGSHQSQILVETRSAATPSSPSSTCGERGWGGFLQSRVFDCAIGAMRRPQRNGLASSSWAIDELYSQIWNQQRSLPNTIEALIRPAKKRPSSGRRTQSQSQSRLPLGQWMLGGLRRLAGTGTGRWIFLAAPRPTSRQATAPGLAA